MKPIVTCLLISLLFACSGPANKKTVPAQPALLPPPRFRTDVNYIKQDSLMRYLAAAPKIVVNHKANRPFNKLHYNKVIAYNYDGSAGEIVTPIALGDTLAPTIKGQAALNQQQVNYITTLLGANTTYGNTDASCFEPHLGLVFFNNNRIVEHISICLNCNKLWSLLPIPATWAKTFTISGERRYPESGFSKTGSHNIYQFFKGRGLDPFAK